MQVSLSLHEPWPVSYLPVPQGSTVQVNCTTNSDSPLWSIDLRSDLVTAHLQFDKRSARLNAHGLYELPRIETPGMPPTLRLLINDTARNNQTVIHCIGNSKSVQTTLFVFGMSPDIVWYTSVKLLHISIEPTQFSLEVSQMNMHSLNVSWSQTLPVTAPNILQTFLLTINHGPQSHVVPLNDSHYMFTAPEGAPPCEVYNFSVTATYVGATYTGAGCSVPSPVLSRMLPSLPDIRSLESSLFIHLVQLLDGLALSINFEVSYYCVCVV